MAGSPTEAGVSTISLAQTPSGRVVEINVTKVHPNPQEATLDITKRANRFNKLANIAVSTGFFDAGIALLAIGLYDSRTFVVGMTGFGVSGASWLHFKLKEDSLDRQAERLTKTPQKLPIISVPSPAVPQT